MINIEKLYTGRGEKPLIVGQDELISQIAIPLGSKYQGSSYAKFSYRSAIDFPIVGVAASLKLAEDGKCKDVRVAAVGVECKPVRLESVEKILIDKQIDKTIIISACQNAAKGLTIVSHQKISPEYRRAMLAEMTKKAISKAWERARKVKDGGN